MLSLPSLSEAQRETLREFEQLARAFNDRLNLYSDASATHFWERHVMHSLALASKRFPKGARVVDWGTGGGIPGLPLAILFPDVHFSLIDAVEKKVLAVRTMARRLSLDNVEVWHGRAEAWEGEVTHSVSRATSALCTLWGWHERVASPLPAASVTDWKSSLLCLKGGDLGVEIADLHARYPDVLVEQAPLESMLEEAYFKSKALVTVTSPAER